MDGPSDPVRRCRQDKSVLSSVVAPLVMAPSARAEMRSRRASGAASTTRARSTGQLRRRRVQSAGIGRRRAGAGARPAGPSSTSFNVSDADSGIQVADGPADAAVAVVSHVATFAHGDSLLRHDANSSVPGSPLARSTAPASPSSLRDAADAEPTFEHSASVAPSPIVERTSQYWAGDGRKPDELHAELAEEDDENDPVSPVHPSVRHRLDKFRYKLMFQPAVRGTGFGVRARSKKRQSLRDALERATLMDAAPVVQGASAGPVPSTGSLDGWHATSDVFGTPADDGVKSQDPAVKEPFLLKLLNSREDTVKPVQ